MSVQGHGRLPMSAASLFECMNCGEVRGSGAGWVSCGDELGARCVAREAVVNALAGDSSDHGPGCDGPGNCVCSAEVLG